MNVPSLQDYRSAGPHPDRREGGRHLRGLDSPKGGEGPVISIVTAVLNAR
jgi:hypothetical protein